MDTNPPTFVFAVDNPSLVHFSYQRFLENHLREWFGFTHTHLRLVFKRRTWTLRTAGLTVAVGSPCLALYILGVILLLDIDAASGQYALAVPVAPLPRVRAVGHFCWTG